MSVVRGGLTLAGFLLLTLPLMPVQAVLVRLGSSAARTLPVWYHRQVCKLFDVRVHLHGEVSRKGSILIAANHSAWLDIVVLSSIAPVSFIAKREVGEWPFISWLAKLQRTIFIDRKKRTSVADISRLMEERLASGDNIVLFPEGTSSNGNVVLPFRSSLLAPILPASNANSANGTEQAGTVDDHRSLQTCAIAYTHLLGLPVGRRNRPRITWYGDMEMLGHGWSVLKSGPIDVHVLLRPPIDLASYPDRKTLTREIEQQVRADVSFLLRNGGVDAHQPAPESEVAFASR